MCLFAQPINRVDATGVEVFGQLRRLLDERGIRLHISGLKLPVERVLRKAGALDDGPLLSVYRTDAEALLALCAARRRARRAPARGPGSGHAVTIQPSSGSSCSRQSVARRAVPLRPCGLHQAQHGVQAVAAGVLDQRVALRMGEFQAQVQPRAPDLQRREQVLAGDQPLGRLPGLLVALVAAPADQLAREQAGIGLQRHAARVALVQARNVDAGGQQRGHAPRAACRPPAD